MEEKAAVKRFVMNLREEISTQVRPLKPTSLNKGFKEALEAEVWCRERERESEHSLLCANTTVASDERSL